MIQRLIGIFLLTFTLGLTACNPTAPANTNDRLQVVATSTLVGDVVKQVAGNAADVLVLMPVGADPHTFQPTPQDVTRLADADLVFVNGFNFEEGLESVIEGSVDPAKLVVVSLGISPLEFDDDDHGDDDHGDDDHGDDDHGDEGDDDHGDDDHGDDDHGDDDHHHEGDDPHVWFDPANVKVWVNNIATSLSAADPANAATYRANADAYLTELTALEAWIDEQLASLPAENRLLVTEHDTLAYFAARYDFVLVGAVIPSASTSASPSAQELAALQDAIASLEAPAVFVGNTVNPAVAQQVAADTGTQLVPIFTDSLSDTNGPAPTYLAFMRHNVEQIVTALR